MSGFHAAPTPFVGREHELHELRSALEAALGGSGSVVLLGGEPGIGKTRLATMAAADATARGVPVCWGHCREDGTAPVFWPWNAALRRWIRRAGDDAVASAAGPLAAELSHVFPILRERLPDLPAGPGWESDRARFRLFDAVSCFLVALAQPAGVVLVLDDVQWADGPSLKLLEFVAADLRQARILVIATYRDTEVRREHPFFATLASLAREPLTRRLTLAGLSAPDCARYAVLAGAARAGGTLGAALHRETNGNPFFLGEIVRLLVSEGRLETGWDPQLVPPGVREVVSRRLDRLGDRCRAALAVAALCGEAFDIGRLAAIVDSPAPFATEPVADVLDRAVRDRILVEVEGRPGLYAFAHALIRRVLTDEIEPSQRAAWHGRIATVIEQLAGSRVGAIAPELVRHFAASGTLDGLRKAFGYARLGAEQAARELGWEEAARLYGIALDLGGRCGMLDDMLAIELQLCLAHALRRSGAVADARARCQAVVIACRNARWPNLLGRAALIYVGPVPEFGRVDPGTRAILEEACGVGDAMDDSLRARLYARLAADIIASNEIEHMERAVALGREAARAAQRAGDQGALALVHMGTFYAAALGLLQPGSRANGGTPTALPSLAEITQLAESAGELELAAQIRHTRAAALFAIGEAEGYWAEIDAIATIAASSRVPEALWLADALAAMRATVEGRFADGGRLMDQALATGVRMQLTNAVGVHMSQRVMWHALQGRLADIFPLLADFVDRHPGGAGWRPVRALAQLARGDEVGARAEFHALVGAGIAAAERGVNYRSYLAGLAALCVGLREREQAAPLYDLVARLTEHWVVDGCTSLGPWALALGSLARLCGRPAVAAAHFQEAIRVGQRMRSRPVIAHAQTQLVAIWLADHPDATTRARAADLLAEAEQAARELDLIDTLVRIERLRGKLTHSGPAGLNSLRREGDFWTAHYAGIAVRLKDAKGLHYLAALLAAPGREFHVLQLAAAACGGPPTAAAAFCNGGAGMTLDDSPDERARREYRARLDDLRSELDEAERFSDLGRSEHLRTEMEQLLSELPTHFGRRVHGPAETARKAVTKALRTQIGKLLAEHPVLGRHLREAVRMGTVCVYAPGRRIDWQI